MNKADAFQDKREEVWREAFFAALAKAPSIIAADPAIYAKSVANSALDGFDAAFPEYAPKKDEAAND